MDLVQWATNPVWSKLPEPGDDLRERLLDDDAPFLVEQLRWQRPGRGALRLVLVNGRSAVNQCRQVGVPWSSAPGLVVGGRTTEFWTARWNGVLLLGWSANLPDSWCSQAIRDALPDHVAHILDEAGFGAAAQADDPVAEPDAANSALPASLAPMAADVLRTLGQHDVDFHLQIWPDRVDVRAGVWGEPVLTADRAGLTLRLFGDGARRLMEACPGRAAQLANGDLRLTDEALRPGEVRGFVVMFALRALATVAIEDLDEPLAADELVEAMVGAVEWAGGPDDMASYWTNRRAALMDLLTSGIGPLPADPDRPWRQPEQDRAHLLELLDESARVRLTACHRCAATSKRRRSCSSSRP